MGPVMGAFLMALVRPDRRRVGHRSFRQRASVTLQSNQTATSVALCPSQNAVLILKNIVGKVANWQYSFGTSSIWYDLPGTEGQTNLAVNGSSISGSVFYRVVVVTELGLCVGQSSVAYSAAFRITKKQGCLSPDGSVLNNDVQTNQHLTIQKAYPNPTSDIINLEMGYIGEGIAQIQIMDLTGRVVYSSQQNLQEGFNTVELDVHTLSSGLYIVKIKDANKGEAMIKLIKE